MHAKQLFGTDVAAFTWQKRALQSHPQDGWHCKQVANAAPTGIARPDATQHSKKRNTTSPGIE